MNETKNYDILILGGGLSGLFAAVRAAECGAGSIGILKPVWHWEATDEWQAPLSPPIFRLRELRV